jgi:hypothetical protein
MKSILLSVILCLCTINTHTQVSPGTIRALIAGTISGIVFNNFTAIDTTKSSPKNSVYCTLVNIIGPITARILGGSDHKGTALTTDVLISFLCSALPVTPGENEAPEVKKANESIRRFAIFSLVPTLLVRAAVLVVLCRST